MATFQTQDMGAGSEGDPYLGIQFLPRCSNCHKPHPLARKPVLHQDTCPDCGEPCGKLPKKRIVGAEITGAFFTMAFARSLLWIGRRLRRLGERIQP